MTPGRCLRERVYELVERSRDVRWRRHRRLVVGELCLVLTLEVSMAADRYRAGYADRKPWHADESARGLVVRVDEQIFVVL